MKTQRITWTQSAPGRGLKPVKITRSGVIVSRKNGAGLVRPDDKPGTLIFMSLP